MQPEQTLQRQTSLSSDAILGEFELRYSVDEDANLYARIASGFRPADLDTAVPGNGIPFDTEHLDSFEAGIKNRWWQGRMLMTLRLFQHNHRDKPEHVLVVQQGQLVPTLANRARVEVRGSEFTLQ